MKKNNFTFYAIFTFGFVVYYLFDVLTFSALKKYFSELLQNNVLSFLLANIITAIPLIVTIFLLFPKFGLQNFSEKTGLNQSVLKGLAIAFISTAPMLIGFIFLLKLNADFSIRLFINNVLIAPFFEEFIYRSFLIGLLFRYSKLGFVSSLLFGSLLFGIAHLYQSQNMMEVFNIFLITFVGSIFFAWVYFETNFNLWTAVFMHVFMNAYWFIFSADENASGGLASNILRFSCLFLSIIIIIYYKKRKKIPLEINKNTLWFLKKESTLKEII